MTDTIYLQNHTSIKIGAIMRTKRKFSDKEDRQTWAPHAIANRKWERTGKVLRKSDAHGLCYELLHEDNTTAWYDPRELEVITTKKRAGAIDRFLGKLKEVISWPKNQTL